MEDVNPSRNGCNLYVKVISIESNKFRNYKGEDLLIRDVVIGDQTAVGHLRLVGNQFLDLKEQQTIALRNARINVVKGYLRLEIDVWGKITQEEINFYKINETVNISKFLYELSE